MAPLDLAAAPIVLKEVSLQGVLTYRRDEFARAIELLATGAIPADELITAVAPLDDAEAAFQGLTAPGNTDIKVLLAP
jgi:threonine dehydrogenase-like Zn-dependent dehydrogenase